MARTVRLALLWHMHQPSYRDPARGVAILPMVFLHAIKDYYEMLRVASRRPEARLTFNLVPSLLDQLPPPGLRNLDSCLFLRFLLAPLKEVEEAERGNLLTFLFMANEKNMVVPLPRYYELFEKRERLAPRVSPGLIFDDQEFLDLTVLLLLAWTGTAIREEEPVVQELLRKGAGFTQEEKEELVGILLGKAGQVSGLYREAQEAGRVEIATSPYYHPILPLLFDLSSAKATERDLSLPVVSTSFAGDAALQLDRGLARAAEAMGRPCRGVWPSEGALSGDTLDLLASRGVAWTASDEQVLANSTGLDLSGPARQELYRPWSWQGPGGKNVSVFFRDRALSDLIGFTYQRWDEKDAVEHFLARVREIRDSLPREDGVIPVILDGENAWEHYPRNGRPFLDLLYRAITSTPGLQTVTFSEAAEACSSSPLGRIVPGSWIGGSLSTWVGHPEKNAAWELIGHTREYLSGKEGGSAPGMVEAERASRWEAAREELFAAEGSDWMWWMGDDHWSSLSDRFDDLFRLHLQNVYRLLGDAPPNLLFNPIKKSTRVGLLSLPVGPVTPVLDGRVTDYFEWRSAGRFDLLYEQGTMHRAGGILHSLRYGFDDRNLYLRVDSDGPLRERLQGMTLAVDLVAPRRRTVTFSPAEGGRLVPDENAAKAGASGAVERVVEVALPLELLGVGPGGEVLLALEARRDGQSMERAPAFSLVKLRVPDDYLLESWVV